MDNRNNQSGKIDNSTNDETMVSSHKNYVSNFSTFFKSLKNRIRKAFSKSCEDSILANFLEKVYYIILNTSIRVVAVFLCAISVSSLVFNYLFELNGLMYFTNINHVGSVMIFIIGLMMFTSKKTVGELLSGSRFFSQFTIVYSQSSIMASCVDNPKGIDSYSSALFLGVIFGIISFMYPTVYLVMFILSFIYVIIIFNRPESGILLTLFAVPFLSNYSILLFTYLTFIAFIYKYLRGKRHMDFGLLTIIMIITGLLFICKGYFTLSGEHDFIITFSYLGFIVVCITVINLVRATSMLYKGINLLASVTRAYIIVFILFYVGCIFFGTSRTKDFLDNLMLTGLLSAVSEMSFFASMLSVAVPVNFAVMISSKNATGFIKNVVYFVIMLMSSFLVSKYTYTLVLLLSCVIVLCCIKKRFLFLIIPCPVITFGIVKLYELIPSAYSASVFTKGTVSDNAVYMLIRDNLLFGIGFGEKNYNLSIARYVQNSSLSRWSITDSTLFNSVVAVGIVGTVLLLVIFSFMIARNFGFILYSKHTQTKKTSLLSSGFLAATLSLLFNCFYLNCVYDFRIAFIFAIVISLGYASKQCIDADYVDATTVREYNKF